MTGAQGLMGPNGVKGGKVHQINHSQYNHYYRHLIPLNVTVMLLIPTYCFQGLGGGDGKRGAQGNKGDAVRTIHLIS